MQLALIMMTAAKLTGLNRNGWAMKYQFQPIHTISRSRRKYINYSDLWMIKQKANELPIPMIYNDSNNLEVNELSIYNYHA